MSARRDEKGHGRERNLAIVLRCNFFWSVRSSHLFSCFLFSYFLFFVFFFGGGGKLLNAPRVCCLWFLFLMCLTSFFLSLLIFFEENWVTSFQFLCLCFYLLPRFLILLSFATSPI